MPKKFRVPIILCVPSFSMNKGQQNKKVKILLLLALSGKIKQTFSLNTVVKYRYTFSSILLDNYDRK